MQSTMYSECTVTCMLASISRNVLYFPLFLLVISKVFNFNFIIFKLKFVPLMNNIYIFMVSCEIVFPSHIYYNIVPRMHILRSIIIMCSYSYRLVMHWNSKKFSVQRIHKIYTIFSNVPISFAAVFHLHGRFYIRRGKLEENFFFFFILKTTMFLSLRLDGNEKYFSFYFAVSFLLLFFYKNRNWWARHFELKMTIMGTFIPIYVFFNLSIFFLSMKIIPNLCLIWSNFNAIALCFLLWIETFATQILAEVQMYQYCVTSKRIRVSPVKTTVWIEPHIIFGLVCSNKNYGMPLEQPVIGFSIVEWKCRTKEKVN